ncbi:MAG TPA: hypothetical protein VNK52_08140 [Hyphomicrobiaceae bacterium]|nr:hypothetical protein [Hyphomicrobiaceae bacterium]
MRIGATLAIAVTAAFAAGDAGASSAINTAGAAGAYHTSFCPAIVERLAAARFDYACVTSAGSAENMRRVARNPQELGYAQADVFALENAALGGSEAFIKIRVDDIRECLFALTRNPDIQNWGEIAVFASKLKFFLPPQGSGSAGTFRFLQRIDADGLGRAGSVHYANSTEEAIRLALSADDGVSLFVQFPDPDNERFRLIEELGGRVVAVIDRNILRQHVDGQKIYFAQETQVTRAGWLKSARKVVTACTPLVLFTGASERIGEEKARLDHRDMIATLRALRPEETMAQPAILTRMWRRAKEISASSVNRLMQLTDEARSRARPLFDKARDATGKAYEKAKEGLRDLRDMTEGGGSPGPKQ